MVWFYRSSYDAVHDWNDASLSIPLWSDFIEFLFCDHQFDPSTFNPTMVWFYLIKLWFYFSYLITFNPTMVWFYRLQNNWWKLSKPGFQSHYGLILSSELWCSRNPGQRPFNPTMVWFYHWRKEEDKQTENDFQSHYGLILSIVAAIRFDNENNAFNPTMVWFYRSTQFYQNELWLPFNPTMVWFYQKVVLW